MNIELLNDLTARIKAAGLSDYRAALLDCALVAIDLKLDGAANGEIGESRFGGAPDLPKNSAWPSNSDGQSLAFLVQINLREIPSFEGNPFPTRGLLSVFLGLDEPAPDVEHRVLIFTDTDLAPAVAPPVGEFANDAYLEIPAQHLSLKLRADVPHWASDDWQKLADSMAEETEIDAFSDLGGRSKTQIGQLLGHVSGIGHDPRHDAYVVRENDPSWLYNYAKRSEMDMAPAQNWRNLLRLDSDMSLGFCVWDAGYLNFLIHQNDLADLNFGRVYAAVETS